VIVGSKGLGSGIQFSEDVPQKDRREFCNHTSITNLYDLLSTCVCRCELALDESKSLPAPSPFAVGEEYRSSVLLTFFHLFDR